MLWLLNYFNTLWVLSGILAGQQNTGGNPYFPCETPSWQKEINFFLNQLQWNLRTKVTPHQLRTAEKCQWYYILCILNKSETIVQVGYYLTPCHFRTRKIHPCCSVLALMCKNSFLMFHFKYWSVLCVYRLPLWCNWPSGSSEAFNSIVTCQSAGLAKQAV
jgi:hypothetical protein